MQSYYAKCAPTQNWISVHTKPKHTGTPDLAGFLANLCRVKNLQVNGNLTTFHTFWTSFSDLWDLECINSCVHEHEQNNICYGVTE